MPRDLLSALLAAVLVLAACSSGGSEGPGAEPATGASARESAARRPAVALVPFRYGPGREYGRGSTLAGCGSIGAAPVAYETPVLVQVRLRVRARVRLLPATYAERSNAIDAVTQFLGPDPGPAAPHLAVSQGVGPTADRLSFDTRLIGDVRDGPAGLAGAKRSWEQRVPLDRPRVVAPGDHYLFVEVDPAPGGMDLHELTARWAEVDGGGADQRRIGGFSLRVLCGG